MKPLHVLAAAVLALTMAAPTFARTTWYVDDDAPGDPAPGDPSSGDPLEDGSTAHPFDAIQEAVDQAVDGDEIRVLDGSYTGPGNWGVDFGGRLVALRSDSGDPSLCVIDCQASQPGFTFDDGETPAAVIDGFTIQSPFSPGNGSAVRISAASPTITNCVIDYAFAVLGGAIHIENGSPMITSCVITDSLATDGGAVYADGAAPTITGCTFMGCYGNHGGAIHLTNASTATVSDCDFQNNSIYVAFGGDGGAMYAAAQSVVLATDCTFSGNVATRGGAIACDEASVSLSGCQFTDNDGSQGSAIHASGASTVSSSFGQFTSESANEGGAIYGGGTLDVDHTGFLTCSAELDGGAVHWTGDATVSYCMFEHCLASRGGGLYLLDGSMQFLACTFFDDIAYSGTGGGVHLSSLEDCGFDGCTFTLNQAHEAGGAVHNEGAPDSGTTTMTSCEFTLNEATWDPVGIGGAVNNQSTTLVLDGCNFAQNTAPDVGGGLNNDGGTVTIMSSLFEGNSALAGGGLNSKADPNDVTGHVELHDTTFRTNGATEAAGVNIHLGTLQAFDSLFEGNVASGNRAGGLRAEPGTDVLLERCDFVGNEAYQDGGGAYLLGVILPVVRDCTFLENAVGNRYGGGLFLANSPGTVEGCRFEGNFAGEGGGGLAYILFDPAPDSIQMATCRFVDNGASDGGGLLLTGGDATLENCIFTANDAFNDGCAIKSGFGNHVTVSNCTVYNNCGGSPFGGVYIDPAVEFVASNSIFWANGTHELRGFGMYVLSTCDVDGGYAGTGNIDADPQLVEVSGPNGPRPGDGSPCIDAGDNFAVPAGVMTDFAGNDRFVDDPGTVDTGIGDAPIVDMGAFEWQLPAPPPCPADLDGNGDVGFADVLAIIAAWGPCAGACPEDLNGNGSVDFADILAVIAAWGACPG